MLMCHWRQALCLTGFCQLSKDACKSIVAIASILGARPHHVRRRGPAVRSGATVHQVRRHLLRGSTADGMYKLVTSSRMDFPDHAPKKMFVVSCSPPHVNRCIFPVVACTAAASCQLPRKSHHLALAVALSCRPCRTPWTWTFIVNNVFIAHEPTTCPKDSATPSEC